jgi:hypothetical protein
VDEHAIKHAIRNVVRVEGVVPPSPGEIGIPEKTPPRDVTVVVAIWI